MGEPQKEKYTQAKHRNKLGARSWGRIDPGALLPTITTSITPACGFQGRWLHWEEHRLLTVMEARRAQGFPDHEVLIGGPAKQWKIIGNSVARTVALALGMSMRSAWLANPPNVTDEEYLSLNVEVDRNHAVDLTREKPLVQISSRRTRTSVIGRLDEQAILSVSKERVTTQPNVSAALEGPRNTTDQENIARKSRTYRLLTAAAVEVQNNHSNPGPLAPKPKRDKEVPRGSMAKPASSPIIVISDDEEEVVYLGTSTPSSRVISSAQETPQNSDSSRTSVSVDELDILQSGTHGLLRQKPSTRRTSNMRY